MPALNEKDNNLSLQDIQKKIDFEVENGAADDLTNLYISALMVIKEELEVQDCSIAIAGFSKSTNFNGCFFSFLPEDEMEKDLLEDIRARVEKCVPTKKCLLRPFQEGLRISVYL